ncbi:MAG: NADPH-dependent FMN reductase [Alphaproteobacteria bacterium]
MPKTIGVIVGSIRAESINRKFAKALEKLAGDRLAFKYLRIDNLPLHCQDLEANMPEAPAQLKKDIAAVDGLLFVTPEYNRSIPGVLKNAIDWASRPYGKNSFAGKPGALCGTSMGGPGTAMAQQHLKNIMLYLDIAVLGQPEVYLQFKPDLIDADGNIANEDTKKFLSGFMDKYVAWVEKLAR